MRANGAPPHVFFPVPIVISSLHRPLRALLPVLLLGLGACAQTFDATTLGVPATLASDASAPAQGVHFQVRATQLWFAWGLLPISEPTLKETLAAQLVGGRSIADVKIRTHQRWTNVLVSVLSAGLLVPRAVEFEGVIVGDTGAPPTTPPTVVPAKP